MWFIRTVVSGAAAFLLLICSSESKPQAVDTSHLGDDAFLNNLEGSTEAIPCASIKLDDGNCSCVPIGQCCGPAPSNTDGGPETNDEGISILEGYVDDRKSCIPILEGLVGVGPRGFFNITVGDRQNSICGDILSVCCETPCPPTPEPPTVTPPSTPSPWSNECGVRNINGVDVTIMGFEDGQAQLGEFPWMVAVLDQGTNYVGGGSLVHPRVILTAAHKVYGKEARDLVARIGDWDITEINEPIPSQNRNVERIVFHPNYNKPTFINNVALLILKSDATLGRTVMPVCLPEPSQNFDGVDCIVTGWGKDVFGFAGKHQKILKEVTVPAVSHSECQSLLRNTVLGSGFNLHSSFNCAGANGEDACEGDGGSPLVCLDPSNPDRYVQMGVVAWGIGCGKVGNPGVYGSIPATVEWINRAIQEEGFDIDIRNQPTAK